MPNIPTNVKLTELLALTLGFKVKRNYDQKQLAAIVAILPRILKYKGTKTAIDIAGNALIAASGAAGSFSSKVVSGSLEVIIPESLVDISLFTDLLNYILPAGMTCRITRLTQIDQGYTTKLDYEDNMLAEYVSDITWNDKDQNSIGLSTMFNTGANEPSFANFLENEDGTKFNAGLLTNNIIPTLEMPFDSPVPDSVNIINELDGTTTTVINNYSVTDENDEDGGSTVVIGGK